MIHYSKKQACLWVSVLSCLSAVHACLSASAPCDWWLRLLRVLQAAPRSSSSPWFVSISCILLAGRSPPSPPTTLCCPTDTKHANPRHPAQDKVFLEHEFTTYWCFILLLTLLFFYLVSLCSTEIKKKKKISGIIFSIRSIVSPENFPKCS